MSRRTLAELLDGDSPFKKRIAWTQAATGVETARLMSTDLDSTLGEFVAGYLVRYTRTLTWKTKLGAERSRVAVTICKRAFQTEAKAIGHGLAKIEPRPEPETFNHSKTLGPAGLREAADKAWQKFAMGGGDFAAYVTARECLMQAIRDA
jgi:hypothetical protein